MSRNNDYKTDWIWPLVVCEHSFRQGARHESVVKPGHSAWLGISLSACIHHCTTRQTFPLYAFYFSFLTFILWSLSLHLSSLNSHCVCFVFLSCGVKRADRLVFQDLKSVSPDARYLFIVEAKGTNTENYVRLSHYYSIVLIFREALLEFMLYSG